MDRLVGIVAGETVGSSAHERKVAMPEHQGPGLARLEGELLSRCSKRKWPLSLLHSCVGLNTVAPTVGRPCTQRAPIRASVLAGLGQQVCVPCGQPNNLQIIVTNNSAPSQTCKEGATLRCGGVASVIDHAPLGRKDSPPPALCVHAGMVQLRAAGR